MSPLTPATQGLHSAPGDGGAHLVNYLSAGQALAIRLSRVAEPRVEDEFGCLAHSKKNCAVCNPPQCECDGDGSYCCPVHDDCQSCGERKGVAMDPSFKTNDWYRKVGYKRAMWFCQECLDAQCSTCGNEPAECKCVAVRYI